MYMYIYIYTYIHICIYIYSNNIRYINSEVISTIQHSNIAEEKMNKTCVAMYGIRYAYINVCNIHLNIFLTEKPYLRPKVLKVGSAEP